MSKQLSIIDNLEIDENGEITGWACLLNALAMTEEVIRECPAPEGGCPRNFTEKFECRSLGVDR